MNEEGHFNKAIEIDKFDIDIDINILLSGCVCTVLINQKTGLNNSFICILYYCKCCDLHVIMGSLNLNICGMLPLLLLISGTNGLQVPHASTPVTCSSESVECEYNSTNLIDIVIQVPTLAECRQLCKDEEQCEFITYYGDTASPVSHLCMLFRSCDATNSCSSCVSENIGCYEMCGTNVLGHMDENLLDVVPDILTELDCKQECVAAANCSWLVL